MKLNIPFAEIQNLLKQVGGEKLSGIDLSAIDSKTLQLKGLPLIPGAPKISVLENKGGEVTIKYDCGMVFNKMVPSILGVVPAVNKIMDFKDGNKAVLHLGKLGDMTALLKKFGGSGITSLAGLKDISFAKDHAEVDID